MNKKGIALVAIVAVLLFSSGCIVADSSRPGYGRQQGTYYYYYPDYEVYYYPNAREYYWPEGREWKHGVEAPRRYNLDERRRVRVDSDSEPHTRHEEIKKSHPPGHYDNEGGEGRDR
jgi:hypothetical protein